MPGRFLIVVVWWLMVLSIVSFNCDKGAWLFLPVLVLILPDIGSSLLSHLLSEILSLVLDY